MTEDEFKERARPILSKSPHEPGNIDDMETLVREAVKYLPASRIAILSGEILDEQYPHAAAIFGSAAKRLADRNRSQIRLVD